jgi:hypothetical protein
MVLGGVRAVVQSPNLYLPVSQVELSDYNPHTYILSAYCAEFFKDNPSTDSSFAVGTVDPILACILGEALSQGLSVQAAQSAVWIYTDRVTLETVQHKFSVSPMDWSTANSVSQRCMSMNPQGQQSFTPQQLSMQGTASQQGAAPTFGTQEQSFWTYGGTLYISPGLVRVVYVDKNPKTAQKLSWSASCSQIRKWDKEGYDWFPGSKGAIRFWFNGKVNGQSYVGLSTQTKEEQNEIVKALSNACGQPWR